VRITSFVLLTLGALVVAGYAIAAYMAFPLGSLVHPDMKAAFRLHRMGILTHIFCSALALAIGPWQFVEAVRRKWPRIHRWMGRVYLGLGVLPGGAAGLYMSIYAFGGTVSHVGFALLAVVWLWTGWMGYAAARRRDFVSHRVWMIRNFALTFGAVTLRIQLGASFAMGWRFEDFYPWLAWTSWVPNALIAEALVRWRRGRVSPTAGGGPDR